MSQRPTNPRLNGIFPLAYLGVNPTSPTNQTIQTRRPLVTDSQGFYLGDEWLIPTATPEEFWKLVNLEQGEATWVQVYPGSGGGGGGTTAFDTEDGTAMPIAGVIQILGGESIKTSAPGLTNIVEIDLEPDVIIENSLTIETFNAGVVQSDDNGLLFSSNGTNGQVLIGSNTNEPVWANLTAGANITITNGSNAITIAASGGGGGGGIGTLTASGGGTATGANVTLQALTPITITGDNASTISIGTTNGSPGQLLIGGGTNPVWASLTSPDGSIVFTPGANTLGLAAAGGGGGNPAANCAFFYYQATATGAVTGSATLTPYALGSSVVMTMLYDNSGGAVTPGNGAGVPMRFIAPATGLYSFQFNVFVNCSGTPISNPGQFITVTGTSPNIYYSQENTVGGAVIPKLTSRSYTTYVPMSVGDIATFSVAQFSNALNTSVVGNSGWFTLPSGLNTFVSGSRLV